MFCEKSLNTILVSKRFGWLFIKRSCVKISYRTRIARKVVLHIRQIVLKNVIYLQVKTSTLTPFVKPCNTLNIAVHNCVFYIQLCVESAFTYIPGSTKSAVSKWIFLNVYLYNV